MSKYILILFLFILNSCNSPSPSKLIESEKIIYSKSHVYSTPQLSFTYKVVHDSVFENEIIVIGTLYNKDSVPFYFFNTTCDGTQYLLGYDTARFYSSPRMNCYANYLTIDKIPAKSEVVFNAYFMPIGKQNRIELDICLQSIVGGFINEEWLFNDRDYAQKKYEEMRFDTSRIVLHGGTQSIL
ncbi:MAG TPA: hypothetical protein PLW44_17085 [Chitinophagales bacterium]|nr:hypothetical protein [Chitinophagales bacterium]